MAMIIGWVVIKTVAILEMVVTRIAVMLEMVGIATPVLLEMVVTRIAVMLETVIRIIGSAATKTLVIMELLNP
jgi:hypothetical protein